MWGQGPTSEPMADVSGPPHISHVEASGGDPSIGCGRGSGNVLGAVG
jgi:hypothetical protein